MFIFVYENKFFVKDLVRFISLYLIIPLGIFFIIINLSENIYAQKTYESDLKNLKISDHINPINKGLVEQDKFNEKLKFLNLDLIKQSILRLAG